MAHPQDYTIVFDSEDDPIFPPLPDAGEDIDFTNYDDPHVYRCVTYVDGHVPERGVPRFSNWDVEVTAVYRIDADGGETKLPYKVWIHAADEIAVAVMKKVEKAYWDSDGGA